MPGFRWFALAAVLIGGSLTVAACSGSDNKSDRTATAAAGSSGNSTPASGETAARGATAQATTSGGGGTADPEVQAIGKKFAQATFNATYKVTGSGADQFSDGILTLEKDGNTKLRLDVTTKQDGKDTAIILIEAGDVSAFCLKDAGELGALLGIEAGKGVCFKTTPTDKNNPVGGLRDAFKDIENVNATLLDKSSRNVAGQDGTCYKTKDNDTSQISTTCFTTDGVMLYEQTEGDSASEIEAQTVSKSVSDDDFKLPYEEKELPTDLSGTPAP